MRKNCREAYNAFASGKECRKAQSIWSNGNALYSYNTPLVEVRDGITYLNRTRYSVTTSIHQNALAVQMPDAVPVYGVHCKYPRHLAEYANTERA